MAGGDDKLQGLQLAQAYERAIDENIISSITDAKGVIVHANRKFCEISKYSEAELVGQNHRILNSGWHSKEFFQNMWRTIGNGNVWHDEIRNEAKDGTYYWVDTVVVPVKNNEGCATHFLSLRTLITERKRLEKAAAKQKQSLEALLVVTTQKVKGPISNCLRRASFLGSGTLLSKDEVSDTVEDLRASVLEFEALMKDLSREIRDMNVG